MKMLDELETINENGAPCSFLSGRCGWIERHHVFGGTLRPLSEKYGLCVFLTHEEHNEAPDGVHYNQANADALRAKVQRIAMEHYGWSEDEFRQIFGRSWI